MSSKLTNNGIAAVALTAVLGACSIGSPSAAPSRPRAATLSTSTECGTYSGKGCAPSTARVDLKPPKFSHPTRVTNPLFPIGKLRSAVLLGEVDGLPFRSETTLLPGTGTVMLGGKAIKVLRSQYTAYLDHRLAEVAIDRYAQADDGSVWYLGEDVYDYEDGTVGITEGTWLAGRDGPAAMIMPGDPKVGDVFRTENVPGIVFEEVAVKKVDQGVDGPMGRVDGAMIGEELHLDGSRSDKVFAPGYGEFYTQDGRDIEALSLAVAADRDSGPEPAEQALLLTSTWGLVESARVGDWDAVNSTVRRIERDWEAIKGQKLPSRVAADLGRSIEGLKAAVKARKPGRAAQASVYVAQNVLDLRLRYRSATYVDIERFHLHAQQLRIFAAAKDGAGVAGEVAALEWIRDRVTAALTPKEQSAIDRRLVQLRQASNKGSLASAADHAARLAALMRTLGTS
ncbi:MAG: hypothetical protein M3Q98_03050 [Actinomycetota bacterium]|nr:hypothetical protein [Actinomycetota bacterium]